MPNSDFIENKALRACHQLSVDAIRRRLLVEFVDLCESRLWVIFLKMNLILTRFGKANIDQGRVWCCSVSFRPASNRIRDLESNSAGINHKYEHLWHPAHLPLTLGNGNPKNQASGSISTQPKINILTTSKSTKHSSVEPSGIITKLSQNTASQVVHSTAYSNSSDENIIKIRRFGDFS